MTTPPPPNIPDNDEPDFDLALERRLREIAAQAVRQELENVVKTEIVPQIQKAFADLAVKIPSEEQAAAKAVALLESRFNQATSQPLPGSNGHTPDQQAIAPVQASVDGKPKIGELIQTGLAMAGPLLAALTPMIQMAQSWSLENKKFALQLKQFELMQTSPQVLARAVAQSDPITARMLGLFLGGDPLINKLPEIQAHTALGAWDMATKTSIWAMQKGLIAQGWHPPDGYVLPPDPSIKAPDNPLGPALPTSPPATSPNPSPAPPSAPSGATSGPGSSPSGTGLSPGLMPSTPPETKPSGMPATGPRVASFGNAFGRRSGR